MVLGLAVAIAVVLALPVAEWRTGRGDIEPLGLAPAGAHAVTAQRVWIDTDAACGASRTTDPDDCLALLALLKARAFSVVGVSTVFGNASIEVTDRTTRELLARLAAEGFAVPPVYRGRSASRAANDSVVPTPAESAMRAALSEAPMTIVALGPITNVAAALRSHPALATRVQRIVAVMGQRPGHVFHPVEGGTARMLLGHGPVFQDFNFAKDREAVAELLALGLPTTLVPYEAAQGMTIAAADLDAMDRGGAAARWAADRSREWLSFWREDIHQRGFFSFDLVAAAYLLHPELFRCAAVRPSIDKHSWYWRWVLGDTGLFVAQPSEAEADPRPRVHYCPSASAGLHDAALADMTITSTPR